MIDFLLFSASWCLHLIIDRSHSAGHLIRFAAWSGLGVSGAVSRPPLLPPGYMGELSGHKSFTVSEPPLHTSGRSLTSLPDGPSS